MASVVGAMALGASVPRVNGSKASRAAVARGTAQPVQMSMQGFKGAPALAVGGARVSVKRSSLRAAARSAGRSNKGTKLVTKAMFERFTEKAIKVVMLAQEEARRLGHNFVGTEQILLGLIGEGTGISAKVLKSMGVNLKEARVEVEKIIGRGSGFVAVEIPFTPRAKRVLELSLEEARQLGHNYIGTEHLLLGLLREGEGVAARVLENLGADPAKIRTQVCCPHTLSPVQPRTQAAHERSIPNSTPSTHGRTTRTPPSPHRFVHSCPSTHPTNPRRSS
jgi:ATP-dependent Clp protease ATP-binding subunit ClpC